VRLRLSYYAWPVLVLALLASAACKEATLGPSSTGDIEGTVLDYETVLPVVAASITTTPPSEALLTTQQGLFRVEDVEVGTYQVTARKSGYAPTTVSVLVRDDRAATATIFLEAEEEEPEEVAAVLDVEVLSFWNTQSGDSTFAEAEFTVRNAGEVSVNAYEVYFRVLTTGDTFFHEEGGEQLDVGESNTRRFRTYIRQFLATDVSIDGMWSDPSTNSPT
jgi:hypothetical protein